MAKHKMLEDRAKEEPEGYRPAFMKDKPVIDEKAFSTELELECDIS